MGTRADFYVGKGANAEWIGSVAWDGYEWGERIADNDHDAITAAKEEVEYRKAVGDKLASRRDGTTVDKGWPWPWEDSRTTDCAYCFVDGKVEAFSWGAPWDGEDKIDWPDMTEKQSVDWGERSGLIFFRG